MPHLLVVIYPFSFIEVNFREMGPRLETYTLPGTLEMPLSLTGYFKEGAVFTLGSNSTNSRPLHSIVTNGANCPLASDEYGCGGEAASNFAELSLLHVPQRQTKCAVLPFPPLTSRS